MASYRFRITFEDYDDISRDIDIKPSQTFRDLHNCIQESIKFDNSKAAAFYMSNDHWIKGREIASEPRILKDGSEVTVMDQAVMNKFINDPHQKIYYEFDTWTFFVELIKINVEKDDKSVYPRCVKSSGDAPKQYKMLPSLPGIDELALPVLPGEDLEPDDLDIIETETELIAETEEAIDIDENLEGFGVEEEEKSETEDEGSFFEGEPESE
ncbi:MAG: hypothetical protein IPO27_01160 [Bacteroidetes bacterium]|nr:hypothetical protein [Bacteroidota bacterium]